MLIVKDALSVVWGLGCAAIFMALGSRALDAAGFGQTLGGATLPLLGAVALAVLTRFWFGAAMHTGPGCVERRTALSGAVLVGVWSIATLDVADAGLIWIKTALAATLALLAHEARLAVIVSDGRGGRLIGIDDREAAIAAHALTIETAAIAGAGAIKMGGSLGHGARVPWQDVATFGRALDYELVVWVGFLLLAGFAALLLRVAVASGEVRHPGNWLDGMTASDDPVLNQGWRLSVFALLFSAAVHIGCLVIYAHVMGPWLIWGTGIVGAALVATLAWATSGRWYLALQNLDGRAMEEGLGIWLLTLTMLGAFWVAVAFQMLWGAGLGWLLFAGLAGLTVLALSFRHVEPRWRRRMLEAIWFGSAAPLVLLLLSARKDGLTLVLLAIAAVGVVGVPLANSKIDWGQWLDWSRDDVQSRGGRAKDGIKGSKMRHEEDGQ